MSDDEGDDPVVSYAARLSALGGEGRRSSFGAQFSLKNYMEEDGKVEKALAFSKPSDHPLFKPFKVVTEVSDALMMDADENEELALEHVLMSKHICQEFKETLKKATKLATESYCKMSNEDIQAISEKLLKKATRDRILAGGDTGERNLWVTTMVSHFSSSIDIVPLIEESINAVLGGLFPLQDTIFEEDWRKAKKATGFLIEEVMNAKELAAVKKKELALSQSQIHFMETIEGLIKLYDSYQKLDAQYNTAVVSHSQTVAELENDDLDEERQDELVAMAAKRSLRSTELKKIRDYKLSMIYQRLEQKYPDIAGSAQNAQQLKQKSIAMHSLELDADILSGHCDHSKSTKFIADLLQICQAWLPLFWALIPALMEIQQHDDKVTPIKALLFEEMKSDSVYGKSLGTVVETQASQLWLVVARGNVESMPALSMGSPEASLFPEIKTGGNGEEVRKSNVEHKNIISLVLYIKHYHEKDLINDRRKTEAILNVAWAEFAEGSILKASERLLVHWTAAMRLGAEVKWHAFFQKAIVALNYRCNGEMQSYLTEEYLNNEALKSKYADNCLPLWNKFLSDVSNLARNMPSDSPRKYTSPDVNASQSSLNAFAGTITPVKGKGKPESGDNLSDWVCNAKGCDKKVPGYMHSLVMDSRKKSGNNQKSCPEHLLCKDCHDAHTGGTDITLDNGKVKSRAKHQKRTGAKANAGTVTDGDGDSSDNQSAADKKKTKRRKANQKRKERMKAAMVLLKEQEKADKVDESVPPAAPASAVVPKKETFSPGSLSADELGQCAKFLAGFQMVSNAGATESSPASEPPKSQTNSSSAAQGSVVKRLMGILSENGVDPSQVNASKVSTGGLYKPK